MRYIVYHPDREKTNHVRPRAPHRVLAPEPDYPPLGRARHLPLNPGWPRELDTRARLPSRRQVPLMSVRWQDIEVLSLQTRRATRQGHRRAA